MKPTTPITVRADLARLDDVLLRLGELRQHLATGVSFDDADRWPAALDEVIALLAGADRPFITKPRVCACGGTLTRRMAVPAGTEIPVPVISCNECEFIEVTK